MKTIKAETETTTRHTFNAGDVTITFGVSTRGDEDPVMPGLVTLSYYINGQEGYAATLQIPPVVLERAAGIMSHARNAVTHDYSFVCELHGYHSKVSCPGCAEQEAKEAPPVPAPTPPEMPF